MNFKARSPNEHGPERCGRRRRYGEYRATRDNGQDEASLSGLFHHREERIANARQAAEGIRVPSGKMLQPQRW